MQNFIDRFRESKVKDNETYVQLATRMRQDFDNWLSLSDKDYDSVREFMIQDQLFSNCSYDLRLFLREQTFDSTLSLTRSADRFRSDATYVQLATRMRQDFDNWLSLSDVDKDYDYVCEFMVQDQLLSNCSYDLRLFLRERTFDSTLSLIRSADRFRSAHRSKVSPLS